MILAILTQFEMLLIRELTLNVQSVSIQAANYLHDITLIIFVNLQTHYPSKI